MMMGCVQGQDGPRLEVADRQALNHHPGLVSTGSTDSLAPRLLPVPRHAHLPSAMAFPHPFFFTNRD